MKSIMKVGWRRRVTGTMNVFLKDVQSALQLFLINRLEHIIDPRLQETSILQKLAITCLHLQVLEPIVRSPPIVALICVDEDEQEAFYGLSAQSYPSLER